MLPPPALPMVGTITGAFSSSPASTGWDNVPCMIQITAPSKRIDKAAVPVRKRDSPNPNWMRKSKSLAKMPRDLFSLAIKVLVSA
jgi:hypothetical protein